MPIVWTKEYSIGVEEMDSQHKMLLIIINRIELIAQGNPNRVDFESKVKSVIQELYNYTVLHFSSEEVILKMFNYPDFVNHKKQHDKFIELIEGKKKNIEALLEEEKLSEVVDEMNAIYNFLSNWLLTHIKKTDSEYTPFFDKIQKKATQKGFFDLFGA